MPNDKPLAGRWGALSILLLASFMNLIDVSIINVALPSIEADTGASSTQLEWVAAIYVLALAVGLLPLGRFGDVFGRRRVFLWGLVGFTITSVFCGSAPGITSLIYARALQGITAAMMIPQTLAIAHVIFPPEEKARVFGLFGIVSSLGAVAGPVVGGALISADLLELGWRLAFLINIPLGIIAFIGTLRFVPHFETETDVHPDWIGIAIFTSAVILLVLPLIEGRALGWPWWCIISLASSLPVVIIFILWERSRSSRALPALMPSELLNNRPFVTRIGLVTLFFSGIPGLFLILAMFFQSGFGLTPLQSGLATTPFPLGVTLASKFTTRFGDNYLNARIAGGAAFIVCGMVLLQFVILGTGNTLNTLHFAVPLLFCGAGMGTAIMALFQVTMSSVPSKDAGAGSGALQAFQQIGAVLGIAIAGQIFFSSLGAAGLSMDANATDRFVRAASYAVWHPIAVFSALTLILSFAALKNRKANQ